MIEEFAVCPICTNPVTISKDDTGTQFFKCTTHGFIKNAKQLQLKNPDVIDEPFKTVDDINDQTPIEELPEHWIRDRLNAEHDYLKKIEAGIVELSVNPDLEELLLLQAHQTVSPYDDHIIKTVFHVGLSTYFKPLNIALKCESGSGKSYSTIETLKFLPPETVQMIGTQSPKVISHENGVKKTKDGEILDDKNAPVKPLDSDYGDPLELENVKSIYKLRKAEWDEKQQNAIYEVDLRNKIICFLESVNLETFKMFKTTMSHDNEYIDHKFVDDKGKVHVTRLVGAPCLIFNSLDSEYVEEAATRCLTATPNTRQEKIEDSMKISNRKSCYPWLYTEEVFNKKLIQEYIRKIKQFMAQGKLQVANPFDGIYECFSKDQVRDMRDFNKFLELMPSYAIFKLFQRPIITIHGKRYLIPTIQDALDAKAAFDAIIETTKTGTDYRVLDFYFKVVAKKVNGCDAETLTDLYNKERKHPTTVITVRKWLNRLSEIGWIDVRDGTHENENGYIDKRFNSYFPLKKKNEPNTLVSNSTVDLTVILQKSFEKWLNNAIIETDSLAKIMILNIDGTATKISIEDMKELILKNTVLIKTQGVPNIESAFIPIFSPSKEEKNPESTIDSKKNVVSALSKRLCSVECGNFDKPSCTANVWQSLNKQSEIPLKCSGYAYVGIFEEAS